MNQAKQDILEKTYISKKEIAILLDISPAMVTKMFSEKYTPHEKIPKIRVNCFGGNTQRFLMTDVVKYFHLEAFVRQNGNKKSQPNQLTNKINT